MWLVLLSIREQLHTLTKSLSDKWMKKRRRRETEGGSNEDNLLRWNGWQIVYCCPKLCLMNYLLVHKSIKLLSLPDLYSMTHILHIYNTNVHRRKKKSLLQLHWEAVKYWINAELSTLWWDKVKEFISHTRKHIRRGYTRRTASLIFCLRPQETISTQFTIQQTLI